MEFRHLQDGGGKYFVPLNILHYSTKCTPNYGAGLYQQQHVSFLNIFCIQNLIEVMEVFQCGLQLLYECDRIEVMEVFQCGLQLLYECDRIEVMEVFQCGLQLLYECDRIEVMEVFQCGLQVLYECDRKTILPKLLV